MSARDPDEVDLEPEGSIMVGEEVQSFAIAPEGEGCTLLYN